MQESEQHGASEGRTAEPGSVCGQESVSVILPARNEAAGLARVLPALRATLPEAEIIVVDDGSTDDTARICTEQGVRRLRHPYSMGNGAAVKTGARHARGEVLVFMDADGQHPPAELPRLLARLAEGYDLVVGARSATGQAGVGRLWANAFYNRFASYMVGRPIADLTSGLRAVRAARFREFLHLLPNGFSYPTTSTMAFFRSGYPVSFLPVDVQSRIGRSHIRLVRDGLRFLLIVFRVATLYSPLRVFVPASALAFALGCVNYLYSYLASGRFTNMSALLFITSVLVFLIGLVSEQITMLIYQRGRS